MSRAIPQASPDKCPVAHGLDLFGDRWSLLIIRDIVFKGRRRYSEFAASPEGISTNILADRLTRLEAAGLVIRAGEGRRAQYLLTKKGEALVPVIVEITAFSAATGPYDGQADPLHGAPPDLLDRMRTDRDALLAEIIANMRALDPV